MGSVSVYPKSEKMNGEESLNIIDGPSLFMNLDFLLLVLTLGHWGTSGSALSPVMTEQHGSDVIYTCACSLTHYVLWAVTITTSACSLPTVKDYHRQVY